MRGASHFGAIRYLQEKNLLNDLVAVSGSSAGAWGALASSLNVDTYKLEEKWKRLQYNAITLYDLVFLLPHLLFRYGLKDKDILKVFILPIFEIANINPDITFEDLFKNLSQSVKF